MKSSAENNRVFTMACKIYDETSQRRGSNIENTPIVTDEMISDIKYMRSVCFSNPAIRQR